MKIYIPSRGRASYTFLNGAYSPIRWLTPALRKRTVYCVRQDEIEQYRKVLPEEIKIMNVGKPKNLSEKRVIIAENIKAAGEDSFLTCDDDVMLYVRKGSDDWHLRYPEGHEVEWMLSRFDDFLQDYPMVGLSPREGNNRTGAGAFPLIRECTRSMRFYAFRTKDLLEIDSGRLPEMADFDTTLQFLRRGQKNAVLYYWAQGQPGSQHPGGCAAYRTSETHDVVCRKLAELHPGFVTLRQKANKGHQHGFGTRTEVTVQWKKAYESSHGNSVPERLRSLSARS